MDEAEFYREKRHRWGRAIERVFRVVEMTAILALLKLVAEPAHPVLTPRLLLIGFILTAFYAIEPVFDVFSKHVDFGWRLQTVLAGAVVFAITIFATFAVFLVVYELSSLLAAFAATH